MELLQKALFNLPRAAAPPGANAGANPADPNHHHRAALDKLGLGHLYGAAHAAAAAAAAASAAAAVSPSVQPAAPPMISPVSTFGVEAVSPNIVFDVASLVLYGTHAIPVRLKILLDRLFSVLNQDDVIQILKGYGWTLEDYQRGYILKDNRGTPLERWQMCSKEEEPLVLQQFLRFGETRPITQQLILQELSERSNEEQRARVQSEIKKLMERNSAAAAAAAAAAAHTSSLRPPASSPLAINNNGLHGKDGRAESSSPHSKASPSVSPSSSAVVSPKAGVASPPASTPTSMNGTAIPPSSPHSVAGSPLNKLQNMQPFDYRKAGGSDAKTPDSISSRGSIERPVPPSLPHHHGMRGLPPSSMAGMGMGLMPNVSVPPSLASYHNSITKAQQEYQMSKIADENSHSALNLTSSSSGSGGRGRDSRPISSSRSEAPSRRSTGDKSEGESSLQSEIRKKMRDNIGLSYISPTTGKKRVQCNVCMKTFCDKGALKIHFSAVHLREMHKCSVDGCNMMFSSRRSRNRHSANPNPKLHTPHLRRKISPHDGRTHQGPFLPGLAALAAAQHGAAASAAAASKFLPPAAFASMPPTMLTPENLQNFQRQQMELQRLHELKMSGLYNHQNFDAKRHLEDLAEDQESNEADSSKRIRLSDSEPDDSTKDESGSVSGSVQANVSKRKSRNPTRITTTMGDSHPEAQDEFSSDDDDEGFENPLDDDDNDDLEDHEDGDEDDNNGQPPSSSGGSGNSQQNNGPEGGQDQEDSTKKDPQTGSNDNRGGENNNASSMDLMDACEIPVDKENPKRCVECGQEFGNHFDVKHHYQNVHLRMMHKCTVEGCNAGFPSKRSRDRHSSNLNLHRKLLSTSSNEETTTMQQPPFGGHNELLARLYTEHQMRAFNSSLSPADIEAKTKEFAAMLNNKFMVANHS